MGVINWDVLGSFASAIATFTGAGVALYISNQWRKQKGSEVSSNISTKIYILLDELTLQIQKLDMEVYLFVNNFRAADKTELNEFNKNMLGVLDRSEVIGSLIDIIITYKESGLLEQELVQLELNNSDLLDFIQLLDEIDVVWDMDDDLVIKNYHEEQEEIVGKLNDSILRIKDLLLPYIYHKY